MNLTPGPGTARKGQNSRLRRVRTSTTPQEAGSGVCSLCGAVFKFSPGKHGQRFCSAACRKKSWMAQKAPLHVMAELRKRIKDLEKRVAVLEGK